MNWYLKVMKQFADFNGRARRKEFWMFFLFNFIFSIAASLIDSALGLTYIVTGLLFLVTIVPYIAVIIRRLHDIGKSGWWILIIFVPLIGGIWLLVLMCTDSQPGENAYGPNPKAEMSMS